MESKNPIEVRVELTFGDLYWVTLAIFVYTLRFLLAAVLVASALWVILWIGGAQQYSWSPSADALSQWLFPYLEGAVPTALVLIPLVTLIRARQIQRFSRPAGQRRYVFGEDEVRVETQIVNADMKWGVFTRVRETKKHFFLHSVAGIANVVPKRCFADEGSLAEFRALVKRRARKFKLRK
jgi:hypothetical protein